MIPSILVINDDGYHSPLLQSFLNRLDAACFIEEIRVVVPSEEQSWISQAITRHRPIYAQSKDFPCGKGFTVSGTPADCASLGIHSLYSVQPEYVFSGINFGINVGLPFHMNSGTVGGASQAFLSGIKSAGFSVQVPRELFQLWKNDNLEELAAFENDWLRLADVVVSLANKMIESSVWDNADLFSVNIPWDSENTTPTVVTKLERRCYESMFSQIEPGCFVHTFERFSQNELNSSCSLPLPGDVTTVESGKVAFTALCPPGYPGPESISRLKEKIE